MSRKITNFFITAGNIRPTHRISGALSLDGIRISHERINGLFRQYIPKGANFDDFSDDEIIAVQRKSIVDFVKD